MPSWLLGVSVFFSSVSVYNGFGLRNKLRDGPLHNEKARGIFFSPNGGRGRQNCTHTGHWSYWEAGRFPLRLPPNTLPRWLFCPPTHRLESSKLKPKHATRFGKLGEPGGIAPRTQTMVESIVAWTRIISGFLKPVDPCAPTRIPESVDPDRQAGRQTETEREKQRDTDRQRQRNKPNDIFEGIAAPLPRLHTKRKLTESQPLEF